MIGSTVNINQKGKTLIYQIYKGDVTRSEITQFCANIVTIKEIKEYPKQLERLLGKHKLQHIDRTKFIICHKGCEYVDISVKGTIMKGEVAGSIQIKCLFVKMPECKFQMNNQLLIQREPYKPNQIPLLQTAIAFILPDGQFECITYRITENNNIPHKITPLYTQLRKTKQKFQSKQNQYLTRIIFVKIQQLRFPVLKNTANVNNNSAIVKAKHETDQQ